MIKRITFWLKNSRLFSLPMTIMSWLIIFLYSLKYDGNIINGILALIGISFAHLATNLFDDYIDYKKLAFNEKFINNSTKSKCTYLKSGQATSKELLGVVIVYCSIAFLIGVYLTLSCGYGVAVLAIIGGLITLTYAKLSSNGFSEIAVGTAFGPLLFEGVYYVMCYKFSFTVLLLSLSVVSFTVGLVYMNNLLDYDEDKETGKKSLCIRLGSKSNAAKGILAIHTLGYLMCILFALHTKHIAYFLPIITFPLALNVYRSIKQYYFEKEKPIEIKWWYFPINNIKILQQNGTANFYIRLFLARNTMIWFSAAMILAMFLSAD